MRLTTIWAIPAMSLAERVRRTADLAAKEAAAHLPARVKYWAALQGIAHATINSPHVPAETVDRILPNIPGGPR